MKSSLLVVALLGIVSFSYGQKKEKSEKEELSSSLSYVSADAKIDKFHTEEELKKMNKSDLTTIYIQRSKVLIEILPYLALHTKPGATLKELGMPENATNIKHLEKEVVNKKNFLGAVSESLDDIIPFADKVNIIWSILLYEDIIKKVEAEVTSR